MTQPDQPPPPERNPDQVLLRRLERRREKIRADVRRSREGGHTIPTWVLATILGLLLLGWLVLIVTS